MSKLQPLSTRSAVTNAIGTVAGLFVALALMIGFFSWQSEYFFTGDTFVTIANDIPAVAVTAVGMTFVLIIAGIDLSVGSVMALAAAAAGIAMLQWNWPLLPATALAMAVGVTVGAVNGAVTVAWRLPSFIVSLGMLEVARGSATSPPTRARNTSAAGSTGSASRWWPGCRRPSSSRSRSSSWPRSC